MKLALVRQRYTPYGGAERFLARALAALAQRQVEVTVLARSWEGDAPYPVETCNPAYLGRLWRDIGFARCVQQRIAGGRFDLVQSHERIPGCAVFRAGDGVHATWLELRGQAQGWQDRVATTLSPWHHYMVAAEAAMFGHPALRAVICNSHMVRDDIARRFGVPEERLHVIHNGVDPAHFNPAAVAVHRAATRARLGIPEAEPVFVMVGSGFARKGAALLLRALAAMRARDAHVIVVGGDRRLAHYQRLAQSLGIAGRSHLVGPQKDVLPYLGAADAFVLPSLYDPMPNAALEALACGLPLVASRSCGAAELIEPGVNGYSCDPLDAGELAAHLDALARPGAAAAMAAPARAAIAGLTPADMAQRLIGLYDALLAA